MPTTHFQGNHYDDNLRLPPNFPKGLRVMVVDDDNLCLKVVEQMLKKCEYHRKLLLTSVTKPIELHLEHNCVWSGITANVERCALKSCFAATTLTNGKSALAMLRERPNDFDLVLCDVYMPGKTWWFSGCLEQGRALVLFCFLYSRVPERPTLSQRFPMMFIDTWCAPKDHYV